MSLGYVVVSARVPQAYEEVINKIALADERTQSAVIRHAIRMYVEYVASKAAARSAAPAAQPEQGEARV